MLDRRRQRSVFRQAERIRDRLDLLQGSIAARRTAELSLLFPGRSAYHIERSFDTGTPWLPSIRPLPHTRPTLNAQQQASSTRRRARPLLVIAGAGTGKTNTLAHRVARLIADGADPAAHPAAHVHAARRGRARAPRGPRGGAALAQRGHRRRRRAALGGHVPRRGREAPAHLRRARRPRAQLHDPRSRRLRGPDGRSCATGSPIDVTQRRFPDAGDVHGDLFARASTRSSASPTCCATPFRAARSGKTQLQALFGAYVDAKQAQHVLDFDDLLLYWARDAGRRGARRRASRELFDHVLVDEYQDTNRLQAHDPAATEARWTRRHGRGRRRAGDLRLPRRGRAQHPRLSRRSSRRRRAW